MVSGCITVNSVRKLVWLHGIMNHMSRHVHSAKELGLDENFTFQQETTLNITACQSV